MGLNSVVESEHGLDRVGQLLRNMDGTLTAAVGLPVGRVLPERYPESGVRRAHGAARPHRPTRGIGGLDGEPGVGEVLLHRCCRLRIGLGVLGQRNGPPSAGFGGLGLRVRLAALQHHGQVARSDDGASPVRTAPGTARGYSPEVERDSLRPAPLCGRTMLRIKSSPLRRCPTPARHHLEPRTRSDRGLLSHRPSGPVVGGHGAGRDNPRPVL